MVQSGVVLPEHLDVF
ncbi:hypothetical protein QP185_18885 [Sphingomonas aerolata]